MVLMSPLLRLRARVPKVARLIGQLVHPVWPSIRFRTTIRASDASRKPDVVDDRREDPLLQKTITAGTFFSLEDAMNRVWRESIAGPIPTLILQAGADRVVDPTAAAEWVRTLQPPLVELIELPDHFHEIFNEPEWPDTSVRIREWLDRQLPL